jgi:uncharacterized repeat protein (TIGR01451 family)
LISAAIDFFNDSCPAGATLGAPQLHTNSTDMSFAVVANTCGGEIAPGARCTVGDVIYLPQSVGLQTAVLAVDVFCVGADTQHGSVGVQGDVELLRGPPITVVDVAPLVQACADPSHPDWANCPVLIERSAGRKAGEPVFWRMNLDVVLAGSDPMAQHLESVTVSYDGGNPPADIVVPEVFGFDGVFNPPTLGGSSPLFCGGRGGLLASGRCHAHADCAPLLCLPRLLHAVPAGGTTTLQVPALQVLPDPPPANVTLTLSFYGSSDPLTMTRSLQPYVSPAVLGSYSFPGAKKDLKENHFWGDPFQQHHGYLALGHRWSRNQRNAEDWGIFRRDGSGWSLLDEGGHEGVAQDHLIWDMPIYAIADGTVVGCGNGFADNLLIPCGGTGEPACGTPAGVNHLWIRHVSGERVLYAHFKQGTIPPELCPADALPEHEVRNGAKVRSGQLLGLVGNSGSGAPHLHIHSAVDEPLDIPPPPPNNYGEGLPLVYQNVRSIRSEEFEANPSNPPWNEEAHAARTIEEFDFLTRLRVEPLPRTNVSIATTTAPAPAIAGSSVVSTTVVTNYGPDAASDASAVIVLPQELDYVSDSLGCVEAPVGTLSCTIGPLAAQDAGQMDTLAFDMMASIAPDLIFMNGGPITTANVVSASSPEFDNSPHDASETITIIASADLSVVNARIVSSPTDLLLGQLAPILVEVDVTSSGPSSPMHATLTPKGSAGAAQGMFVAPAVSAPALKDGELRSVLIEFMLSCSAPGGQTAGLEFVIAPELPDDVDPVSGNDSFSTSVAVDCILPVAIDVKPGSRDNPIKVDRGTIPVAILTTTAGEYGLPLAFDATTIDPASVRFGEPDLVWAGGGSVEAHGRVHLEDTHELDAKKKDKDLDLVVHFPAADTGFEESSTEGCARGVSSNGAAGFSFFGCDTVKP